MLFDNLQIKNYNKMTTNATRHQSHFEAKSIEKKADRLAIKKPI